MTLSRISCENRAGRRIFSDHIIFLTPGRMGVGGVDRPDQYREEVGVDEGNFAGHVLADLSRRGVPVAQYYAIDPWGPIEEVARVGFLTVGVVRYVCRYACFS